MRAASAAVVGAEGASSDALRLRPRGAEGDSRVFSIVGFVCVISMVVLEGRSEVVVEKQTARWMCIYIHRSVCTSVVWEHGRRQSFYTSCVLASQPSPMHLKVGQFSSLRACF